MALLEMPKIGDKVRYLGGDEDFSTLALVAGNTYEINKVIYNDRADAWEAHIDLADGDTWYVYGEGHRHGCDFEKYELVKEDAVNSPQHYTQGAIEVIDYIDQVADGYEGRQAVYAGNIIKYVSRAPYKNQAEDIRKAIWYAQRLVDALEAEGSA